VTSSIIPYLNILYPHMGPSTTPGPQASTILNPALNKPSILQMAIERNYFIGMRYHAGVHFENFTEMKFRDTLLTRTGHRVRRLNRDSPGQTGTYGMSTFSMLPRFLENLLKKVYSVVLRPGRKPHLASFGPATHRFCVMLLEELVDVKHGHARLRSELKFCFTG